jgi:hypothetical protein
VNLTKHSIEQAKQTLQDQEPFMSLDAHDFLRRFIEAAEEKVGSQKPCNDYGPPPHDRMKQLP